MFPQVIRRRCAGAQNIELVYYSVRRESVEIVYYNVARSDAEAGPSEEEEYHVYEEIDQQGGAEAGPSEETEYPEYEEIPVDQTSEETECQQYEEVDVQGGAEAAGRGRTTPVYEVDL